jgi:hypothetical protein
MKHRSISFEVHTKYVGLSNEEKENYLGYRELMSLFLKDELSPCFNQEMKIRILRLFINPFTHNPSVNHELGLSIRTKPEKRPDGGMATFFINSVIDKWGVLNDQQRKQHFVDIWLLFFNNLPLNYFAVDKTIILDKVKDIINQDWILYYCPIKKKLKYNANSYSFELEVKPEHTTLSIRNDKTDELILIENYLTGGVFLRCDLRGFELEENVLRIVRKNPFEEDTLFDMSKLQLIERPKDIPTKSQIFEAFLNTIRVDK